MQQGYVDLRGRIRLPVILQTEAAECGIACLAMIACFFGHRIDIDTVRRRHPVSLKGMTLRGLIETARHLELACRPLRIELAHLAQLPDIIFELSNVADVSLSTVAHLVYSQIEARIGTPWHQQEEGEPWEDVKGSLLNE